MSEPVSTPLAIYIAAAGATIATVAGVTMIALRGWSNKVAGAGGTPGSNPSTGNPSNNAASSIPRGPITDQERQAAEQVMNLQPEPKTYKDDAGRIWTPCVDWWLGKGIPDWPPGVWPGQVPYLRKPVDVADWLGCIAGYLVYKGPLAKAASETYPDEAITVEITKRLTARREVLRKYVAEQLAARKRGNAPNQCAEPNTDGQGDPSAEFCAKNGGKFEIVKNPDGSQTGVCVLPGGERCDAWAYFRGECGPPQNQAPLCTADARWPETEAEAAAVWSTIEIAARKRLNAFNASRSTKPLLGGSAAWTAAAGPYWEWCLRQSLPGAFAVAKIADANCRVGALDDSSVMAGRLQLLADDIAATLGDTP